MQTAIVIIIVCLAAAYLLKTFFGKSDKKGGCGCGCASCPTAGACDEKETSLTNPGVKDSRDGQDARDNG
jgi:hypothetical protein